MYMCLHDTFPSNNFPNMYTYIITDIYRTECIDIEPCDHCFTLPCACTIININIYGQKGERCI